MKIISLNMNGFYNPNGKFGNNKEHDYYDFEGLKKYIGVELIKSKDIIFCLQELRLKKEDEKYKEEINWVFSTGFTIIYNCDIFREKDKNKFLEKIEKDETFYFANIILIDKDVKLEKCKREYIKEIKNCSDEIKDRFSCCKIKNLTKNKYFYLFNLHLFSEAKKDKEQENTQKLKGQYLDVLNKIIKIQKKEKDYCLLVGDFNYFSEKESKDEKDKYNEQKEQIMKNIEEGGFYNTLENNIMNNFTYKNKSTLSEGIKLDYIFASKRFYEDNNFEFQSYISPETNVNCDKTVGFTDHSALVLVILKNKN